MSHPTHFQAKRIMKYSSNRLNSKAIRSSASSMWMQLQQMLTLLVMVIALCASRIAASPAQQLQSEQQMHQTTTVRVQQCREGCLEKVAPKSSMCQKITECSTCWDACNKTPATKLTKPIHETWSLHTVSMVQQDSLVLVDVAWDQLDVPYQCLVTWEVSGGGLMGNLLTESFSVQLSLWAETKYRVQVTCKNKLSGLMSRSLPLTIDTSDAVHTEVETMYKKESVASPSSKESSSSSSVTTTNKIGSVLATPARPAKSESNEVDSNIVRYDYHQQQQEQLNESKSQRTNFVFNWHIITKSSNVASLQPEEKLLTFVRNVDTPLVFGMAVGIVLLVFLLLFILCFWRNRQLSSDKVMLIAEDCLSMPPTQLVSHKLDGCTAQYENNLCKSPATCSRYTLRV